jgi:hypothetical protein
MRFFRFDKQFPLGQALMSILLFAPYSAQLSSSPCGQEGKEVVFNNAKPTQVAAWEIGSSARDSAGKDTLNVAACRVDSICQRGEPCETRPIDCGDCNSGTLSDLGHDHGDTTITFENVTASVGLDEPLDCMMGHAAAWGDLNSDGWPDLFFGTFADRSDDAYYCSNGPRPDRLLLSNRGQRFDYIPGAAVEKRGRCSGAVFIDLDNDGDLDLVVSHTSRSVDSAAPLADRKRLSNFIFENDNGTLVEVTERSGLSIVGMAARNIVPIDYDGDGDLDLYIVADMTEAEGGKLFRNDGVFRFTDATEDAGINSRIRGLGAASGDFNNDGWPDLFVLTREQDPAELEGKDRDRLYLNNRDGTLRHEKKLDFVFQHAWPEKPPNLNKDWHAGVAIGDINRDGWLDIAVGQHYKSAVERPTSIRLFVNTSSSTKKVSFVDATKAAELPALASKAPHLEIQDMDNDGWPDIVVSMYVKVNGIIQPLVLHNKGYINVSGGIPKFVANSVIKAGYSIGYTAAGPTADYDRDGRLDLLMPDWMASVDSALFRNVSLSGNYLEVAARPVFGANANGIGARVELYEAGRLGNPQALIGHGQISIGYGYSSGQEAVVHLGLADRREVDMRMIFPHDGPIITRMGVVANQRIIVK